MTIANTSIVVIPLLPVDLAGANTGQRPDLLANRTAVYTCLGKLYTSDGKLLLPASGLPATTVSGAVGKVLLDDTGGEPAALEAEVVLPVRDDYHLRGADGGEFGEASLGYLPATGALVVTAWPDVYTFAPLPSGCVKWLANQPPGPREHMAPLDVPGIRSTSGELEFVAEGGSIQCIAGWAQDPVNPAPAGNIHLTAGSVAEDVLGYNYAGSIYLASGENLSPDNTPDSAGVVSLDGVVTTQKAGKLGFFGATPIAKPSVVGTPVDPAAASLLAALVALGLVSNP